MIHEESSAAPDAGEEAGQLVVIQPRVVENADHVFGNLFQRLYYGLGRVHDFDGELGAELEDSARRVEQALQLMLDYIAPFPPSLERFAAADLARSLAQRIEAATPLRITLEPLADDALQVMIDAGRLGRAFDLMASRLLSEPAPASPRRATVGLESRASVASVVLRLPAAALEPRSSIGELRWAVAGKLVEIHGGTLEERSVREGEVVWRVSLPREP